MANQPGIARQQAHPLFLCLNKQQFVERILMLEWLRKPRSRVTGRQR
jgi:hypothetical protein